MDLPVFQVGDRVRVIDYIEDDPHNSVGIDTGMYEYAGKEATITDVMERDYADHPSYFIDIDDGDYYWDAFLLEPVGKPVEIEVDDGFGEEVFQCIESSF